MAEVETTIAWLKQHTNPDVAEQAAQQAARRVREAVTSAQNMELPLAIVPPVQPPSSNS